MSIIDLREVSFYYPDGHLAVDALSLSVDAKESIAVIGQNGAGKTTTVKLMNGLLRPSAGLVTINGTDTSSRTTAQISRDVGYVFQNPDDQIFHEDVASEIAFGPRELGLDYNEVLKRTLEAAELCKLTEALGENPYNIPFSLRKFVTIASVIAMEPRVVILDEPTSGQDAEAVEHLARIVETLQAQGKAVITITHDMEFVAKNFTRTVVMVSSRIIRDAPTHEIFADHDLLAEASIAPTFAGQIAHNTNLPTNLLSMPALVTHLTNH